MLRVTLLGTGSPSPSLVRHHPAAIVHWGDHGSALVDAGDSVVGQLLAAGEALRGVDRVLFTHLHWDHILGYPALVWGSWTVGRTRLDVTGPTGTQDMHRRLVEDFYRDQAEWAIDLGYDRDGWDNTVVRDVEAGWSTEVDGCRIEAGSVVHPPMASLAWRFTFGGRSLVVSGDTARCDELVAFAHDADVLVVDACASAAPLDASAKRRTIVERLHEFHASPQDCVDMAAAARVATVVLTHHLPEARLDVDTTGYGGTVIIGNDLDVIEV